MLTHDQSRLRPDPTERFALPEQFIDLDTVKNALESESSSGEHGHKHETLYKTRSLTLATFAFEPNGELKDHVTKGVVIIQTISGKLQVKTSSHTYELIPGTVVILQPNVVHSVRALEKSQMLLTVEMPGDSSLKESH